MSAIHWVRLAKVRTPVLMVLAMVALCGGVGTGVFMFSVPIGWIVLGVLVAVCLAFLAYVTDEEDGDGRATRRS